MPRFLLCVLAGSQPSHRSGPGCSEGDKHADVLISLAGNCSRGADGRAKHALGHPLLLAGRASWGDGPGMSWCACDCGDGAFCLGGLFLPSSKGVWNVLLSMGLLVAWLLHWGTALVGQRLLVTLASSRGCWLPVLEEPMLAGTFPG